MLIAMRINPEGPKECQSQHIEDEDGSTLKNPAGVLNRWGTYVRKLLK